jgi:ABC-type sugar transport system substrate-binding protein
MQLKHLMTPAVLALAAGMLMSAPAHARDANAMMQKTLGTTDGVDAITAEAFKRAAQDLTPAQQELALKCWKDSVCETGQGDVTVALSDGFGENVWREITKMEFITQALTYPNVKKIIYTTARLDAQKAISDVRSLTAQGVNVLVIFADHGPALLPAVQEATKAGVTVVLHNGTYVGGEPGKDFASTVGEDICLLGVEMVKAVSANSGKDSIGMVELGGTPGNGLSAGWQKCADEEAAKHPAIKIIGKADTNWTQEGAFQAMSGFLAQGDVDAVIYEYADGFRGGLKAFQDAGVAPNIVVGLRTDEQGLFCDWEKANNPNFKIFFAAGMNFQAAVALTAGMQKLAGQNIPTVITPPFKMRQVVKGMCNPDLPDLSSGTTLLEGDMLKAMYPK